MPKNHQSTVVLGYHAIRVNAAKAEPDGQPAFYSVDTHQFDRQMEYLSREKFITCLPEDFLGDPRRDHSKSVMITFDDGHESDFLLALPSLMSRGFRAVFFICIDFIGRAGYLTWEQIGALAAAGMSIQSHGMLHHDLTRLSEGQTSQELRAARLCLERNVKKPVRYISIPGGFVSRVVYRAAEGAGYDAIFNSRPALARPGKILPRIMVRRNTSQCQFEGLVQRRRKALFAIDLLHRAKSTLKGVLGVERYDSVKQRLWT